MPNHNNFCKLYLNKKTRKNMIEKLKIIIKDIKNSKDLYQLINQCVNDIYDYDKNNGTKGYLYCLHNVEYNYHGNNVYKLGKAKNINRRMNQYTTSYLYKSNIMAQSNIAFINYSFAENMLFYYLLKYRIESNREFFKCPLIKIKEKIKLIETICYDLNDDSEYSIAYKKNVQIDLLKLACRYSYYLDDSTKNTIINSTTNPHSKSKYIFTDDISKKIIADLLDAKPINHIYDEIINNRLKIFGYNISNISKFDDNCDNNINQEYCQELEKNIECIINPKKYETLLNIFLVKQYKNNFVNITERDYNISKLRVRMLKLMNKLIKYLDFEWFELTPNRNKLLEELDHIPLDFYIKIKNAFNVRKKNAPKTYIEWFKQLGDCYNNMFWHVTYSYIIKKKGKQHHIKNINKVIYDDYYSLTNNIP
jgi:hypothetical protein